MYYGDWRVATGIGYNKNVFQFAYGRVDASGGLLRGVMPLLVVAGHTIELQFEYFESQGKWEILNDDLNDGIGIQYLVGPQNTKNTRCVEAERHFATHYVLRL